MTWGLMLVVTTIAQSGAAGAASVVPGCGELAVYSLLRATGSTVSLSEVSRELRSYSGFDRDAASIQELRQSLLTFGCPTDAVRFRPSDLRRVPSPSILYFREGRWDARFSTGHFVLFLGMHESGRVELADWSQIDLGVRVLADAEQTIQRWDGEAIILHKTNSSATSAVGLTVLALIAFVAFVRERSRATRENALRLAFVGWPILFSSGCDSTKPVQATPSPVLHFDQPVRDLGNTKERSALVRFPFRVGEQPLTITGTGKTCQCLVPDQTVLNQRLEPGSQHEFSVQIDLAGVPGAPVVRTISVITEPVSPVPIVLAIRFRPIGQPVLSTKDLLISSKPEQPAQGEISLIHHRGAADTPISVVREQCRLEGFRITDVKRATDVVKSKIPGQMTEVTIDTTRIGLVGMATLSYGEHRQWQELVLSDGTRQRFQTIVRVSHPFTMLSPRAFVGSVKPGATWKTRLPVRHDRSLCEFVASRSERSDVRVEYADDVVMLTGVAPGTAGRFTGSVTLSFRPKTIPEIQIPFSGLVTEQSD